MRFSAGIQVGLALKNKPMYGIILTESISVLSLL